MRRKRIRNPRKSLNSGRRRKEGEGRGDIMRVISQDGKRRKAAEGIYGVAIPATDTVGGEGSESSLGMTGIEAEFDILADLRL